MKMINCKKKKRKERKKKKFCILVWNIAILFQWRCVCEHNMYLAENVWPNQLSARQFKSIISVAEIQSGKHDFMNANSPPNLPVSVRTNQTNSHLSFIKKNRQDKNIFISKPNNIFNLHIM